VWRPDWPAPAGVQALCTTRLHPAGGAPSLPPYHHFNLGDQVGDGLPTVLAQRRALAQQLGVRPVYLRQVHGCQVQRIAPDTPDGLEADASFSALARVACTVLVADCLPVLLCSADGRVLAAAHAGWRGLVAGVLQATVKALRLQWAVVTGATTQSAPVLAWLGPCIGQQAFEVGPEVRAAFLLRNRDSGRHFVASGADKYRADLAALARQQLAALGGVALYGNDSGPMWCTASNPARWYSHRRDRVSGRMAACVWRH